MAYPTGVAFKSTTAPMGTQPIHESSSTKKHELGTIIQATDITYGEGEFIYLAGVASTAQGDVVVYNSKTGATVRAASGATPLAVGPVAVAAAAIVANEYGWYQISGSAPWNAATAAADKDVYLTGTAGQVDDLVDVGDKVDGAAFKAATSGGFATVQFNRPSVAAESVATNLTDAENNITFLQSDVATLDGAGLYCTLSAAAEAGDAIVVTGQVKTLLGADAELAIEVVVRSLAVTADKGDITVTTGTSKKVVNPATGENVAWLTTDATGGFAVSIANDAAEDTLVTAAAVTVQNGLVSGLKLTFA